MSGTNLKKRRPPFFQKNACSVIAVISLLSLLFFLGYFSARRKSVTVDEFVHLPVGYQTLLSHAFRMESRNPPLVRMLAAVPLLHASPRLPEDPRWDHAGAWYYGYEFMRLNAERYQPLFLAGRTVVLCLSLALGLLVYIFASHLYGRTVGLAALFLYCLNPDIIAHSRITTLDLGLSLFFMAALYFFYRFIRNPGIKNMILCGLFLGLAQTAKFTALFLLLIFPLILLVLYLRQRSKRLSGPLTWKVFAKLVAVYLMALLVINSVYFWEKTGSPLGAYEFETPGLRLLNHRVVSWIPVPLPYHYLKGIDRQRAEKNYTFYLFGKTSKQGWWYYFPVAFLVKTPVPLLLLILLAFFRRRQEGQDAWIVLGAVFFFYAIFFMFFSHKYIGLRYLLPLMPIIFIFAARSVLFISSRRKILTALICLMMLWYTTGSLRIYPHYLSYFNEIAGGPSEGHRILADSNLDWGQDLIGLKAYMQARGIRTIRLAYFGRVDPAVYGISFTPLGELPEPGVAAVSVNYLLGLPYFLYYEGETIPVRPHFFSWLNRFQPVDRVGYSILVYNIPFETAEGYEE